MKVLFVVPEVRLDDTPFDFPFWAGILAAIVNQKKGQVAILDLNALRMNYGGGNVPDDYVKKQIFIFFIICHNNLFSFCYWWHCDY